MELHLFHICTFLSLVVVGSYAALLPSEDYWKSVLPNSPLPKSLTDLLPSEYIESKGTSVGVRKGGVNANTGKGKKGGPTKVNVGKGSVGVRTGGKKGGPTKVNVGKGSVGVSTGKPGKRTNVGVGKGGVSVGTGRKGKPVNVKVQPTTSPFIYNYAATENQLHDNPNVALFFLEQDMHAGETLNLNFIKSTNAATFLPRQVAKAIPFSSAQLPEILTRFSIKPDSVEAEMVKKTIAECEEKGIKGEDKYCPTSLESMIEFSTSKLGKNIHAISTEVDKESGIQSYSITGVKKMASENAVVCHKQDYVYAVFYCHKTSKVDSYVVSLFGKDGTKAKAAAVCHKDTSAWNPNHLAFKILKVKPGNVPVCHFLPEDHVVWVPY